jgi:GNAT superfamily N-acetyltransferase
MNIREAIIQDIPQIQVVRNSVKENILSDPSVVSDADCVEFITQRGKGWVYEIDNKIVGFAIVDLQDNNIWALFLHPDFEKKGIGRKLHDVMLNWYFAQDKSEVWLGTTPDTRAENFYRAAGWLQNGMNGDEIRFEMTKERWEKNIMKQD